MTLFVILILVFAVGMVVSQHAAGKFESAMLKGRRVVSPEDRTGAQIADEFLHAQGVDDVKIVPHEGMVSNYFDPRRRRLFLQRDVREGKDLAAWSVALHEAAHALQTGEDKEALQWRHTCINLCRYLPTTLVILAVIATVLLKMKFRFVLMAFTGACGGCLLLNFGTLAMEHNANKRLHRWLDERLARHPDALDKMDVILSAVATRELGDMTRSGRYFFFSALPGTGKKRPT